jgi:hypothetical protein
MASWCCCLQVLQDCFLPEHIEWADLNWPTDELFDLLQLSMNCRHSTVALHAAVHVPAQLTRSQAVKLLRTAANRNHAGALWQLLCCSPVQQHVDTALLDKMIMKLCSLKYGISGVTELLKLPAAAQLRGSNAVLCYLLEAANHSSREVTAELCQLPVVQQMSAQAFLQLMQAHRYTCSSCVEELCKLPAAAQLNSKAVGQLLQLAFNHGFVGVEYVRELPGARGISKEVARQLVDTAFELDDGVAIDDVSNLPAVDEMLKG